MAEPCASLMILDSCMFAAPDCNAAVTSEGLIIPSLAAGQSCEAAKPSKELNFSGALQSALQGSEQPGSVPTDQHQHQCSFCSQLRTLQDFREISEVWEAMACELDCPDVAPPQGIEERLVSKALEQSSYK